jgi:large subunit ribosomal protein L21
LLQEIVMYAIILDGGHQYKVEEGQILDIDLREASTGDQVVFDKILACSNDDGLKIGQPLLKSASVTAEIVTVSQGPKLVVQKFRRRKNSRRKTGHRQLFTQIKINKIDIG